MRMASKLAVLALLCGCRVAMSEAPHIQYAFPAGGRQGTSFNLEVGGLHLDGATNVFVSGEGVQVEIVKFGIRYEPRTLRQLHRGRENRMAALEGKEGKEREKLLLQIQRIDQQIEKADLPEGVDPFDKRAINRYMKVDSKEQFNPQISHRLYLRVTLAKNAPPGERELRVYAPSGLSNPLYFQVGTMAETLETEPNDDASLLANGPLVSGSVYYGAFPSGQDTKDYYFFDLSARGTVKLWLQNIPAGHNYDLVLRDDDLATYPGWYSLWLGNQDEFVEATIPAGRYHIQIHNASGLGSNQPYHLQIQY